MLRWISQPPISTVGKPLTITSEESVASMARLALALILMSVLAAIVISDALSMVISALAEQDRIAVLSLIA